MSTAIIAAANSNASFKAIATAVCTGADDQNVIGAYLTTGNNVQLGPSSDYYISASGYINMRSNCRLYGTDNTTIVHLANSCIYIVNVNNVEVDHMQIQGTAPFSGPIFISNNAGTPVSGFKIHDILDNTVTGGVQTTVQIYSNNALVSNIVLSRIDNLNSPGFGVFFAGEGAGQSISNVVVYKCTAEYAGVYNTSNAWATGFDFAETTGLTVSHLYVINCNASYSLESNFHFEDAPTKIDVILTGNTATYGGQKPSNFNNGDGSYGVIFGYGFVSLTGDVIFCNNFGSNNLNGDLRTAAGVFSPPITQVTPPGSTKTATPVNQANCSGCIVTTTSGTKTLVLYSNDGNPVNQQIYLGGYYASNDGNSYTFNGQNVIASFTDYIVMQLIQTGAPPTGGGNFGNNGAGMGNAGGLDGSYFFSSPGYAGVNGAIASMSVLADNSDGANAHNIQLGLYSVSGGIYTLVAHTGSISIPAGAAKQWFAGNTTTTPTLSSGTTYVLLVRADNAAIEIYYDTTVGKSLMWETVPPAWGSWDASFTGPTTGTSPFEIDIFATVAAAGLAINTSIASSVTTTSATLNGAVTATGGDNPTVTVYWGTTDGGQVAGNWQHNSAPTSPTQPQGAVSFYLNIAGLNPNTQYYFNVKATNSGGTAWGTSATFTTTAIAAPSVTISAPSSITAHTATLNGAVTAPGGDNPSVTFYWGTTDGGQVPGNWQHSSAPTSPSQPQGAGACYLNVTGLSPNTVYYCNLKATNSGGTSWGV